MRGAARGRLFSVVSYHASCRGALAGAARNALLWALSLLSTAACYGYVPLESPQRGMEVRAQLTSEAAVRRSQGLDEPILRYEGVVVDVRPDTLALDVLVARASGALQDVVIRDTVSIPTREIQTVMQRKVSVMRTTLFTLAAAAGAAAVVAGIDQVVGGTGEPGNGGEPTFRPPLSLPIVRIVLGLR